MTFWTYLLSFLEFLTVFVDDGRDMLEVAHLDKVFRRGECDWLLREFHRVQPVLDVLDLSRAEHKPLLSIRKSAYKYVSETVRSVAHTRGREEVLPR